VAVSPETTSLLPQRHDRFNLHCASRREAAGHDGDRDQQRIGTGKLAEVLGEQAVERDRLARAVRYRGKCLYPLAERETAGGDSDTTIKVNGSVGVTPNSRLEPARLSHRAPTSPSTIPVRLSFSPSPRIMRKIALVWAPTAIRIPISRVRVAMEYWMSP
jgi:hypothetical protein